MAGLREAAMAYLARFAASEVGLTRVLDRRIQRWARYASEAGGDPDEVRQHRQQAREAVRAVVSDMMRLKLVDDTMFADGRARALSRGGRSRRAIAAHLASRGIDAERIAGALLHAQSGVLDDVAQAELAAALLQARKRRIGPFGVQPGDGDSAEAEEGARQRALAALARAGFSHDVARNALETDLETAEALIARLRGG